MKDVLTKTCNINIAGWEFVIHTNYDNLRSIIERFTTFLSNPKELDNSKKFNIFVTYKENQSKLFKNPNIFIVEESDNIFIVGNDYFRASYDFVSQKGILENYVKNAVAMDAYLRFAVSYLCHVEGGVLVHSAGIIDEDNRSFIFTGPSSSGKTTVSNLLSKRFSVIGEELQIILPKKDEDGYKVYGTPFLGSSERMNNYGGGNLKGIIFHKKSDSFYMREMDLRDSLFSFLETSVVFLKSRDTIEMVLNNLEKLIKQMRVFEMGFTLKDDWIEDFSREVINIQ